MADPYKVYLSMGVRRQDARGRTATISASSASLARDTDFMDVATLGEVTNETLDDLGAIGVLSLTLGEEPGSGLVEQLKDAHSCPSLLLRRKRM